MSDITYDLGKKCEVCESPIPDNFGNSLCLEHYEALTMELNMKRQEQEEETQKIEEVKTEEVKQIEPGDNGITDPNYVENPEAEDKNQVLTNLAQFSRTGNVLWGTTRDMYTWIKNCAREKAVAHPQFPKFVWKPNIIDVGCGCGLGSNILSQEANFVWGIDKNELSIKFATECFTREKNNIYYTPQISFDKYDIIKDNRETMKFDFVVAIEIIEHIADCKGFLTAITQGFDKKMSGYEATEYFISTPNRNNSHINKDKPQNKHHVREWTAGEYLDVLSQYFQNVELFNSKGEPIPKEEYRTTNHTPLLARCSVNKNA